MRLATTLKISLAAGLLFVFVLAAGCSGNGGAEVYLEDIDIGNISLEGKPVTGLPAQKVNIIVKTENNKLLVSQSGDRTIIKLQPSGTIILSSSEGLSFTGLKPEQVEIRWSTDNAPE